MAFIVNYFFTKQPVEATHLNSSKPTADLTAKAINFGDKK